MSEVIRKSVILSLIHDFLVDVKSLPLTDEEKDGLGA